LEIGPLAEFLTDRVAGSEIKPGLNFVELEIRTRFEFSGVKIPAAFGNSNQV
jgi:hypothetical protein